MDQRRKRKINQLAKISGVSRGVTPLIAPGIATPQETVAENAPGYESGQTSMTAPITPGRFDRLTNPMVEEVIQDEPELFADWTDTEWDELYSLMGMGGPLRRQGVVDAAIRINAKRETVQRLQVVLETHLREVAEVLVLSLFRLVQPGDSRLPDAGWQPPSRVGPRDHVGPAGEFSLPADATRGHWDRPMR